MSEYTSEYTPAEARRLWLEKWDRQLWEMVGEMEEFFGASGENNPDPVEEAVRSARYVVSAEFVAAQVERVPLEQSRA